MINTSLGPCEPPFQWQLHYNGAPVLHYVGKGGVSFGFIARAGAKDKPLLHQHSVFLNWAGPNDNLNGAPVESIEAGMRLIETLCENALKA